jgi:hypothetical protein
MDAAAVRHLMVSHELAHQRPVLLLDLGELTRYERPLPHVNAYDDLLVAGGAR